MVIGEEEYIVKGSKEYADERGKISNFELPEPINWIGLITSKTGTVRANHFHPVQEQKVLLISGSFLSLNKDLADESNPTTEKVIRAGDLVVTPPNIAHTMVFLEDSVFLNLVNGEREHENYGEHTKPYELIDPKDTESINAHIAKYGGGRDASKP